MDMVRTVDSTEFSFVGQRCVIEMGELRGASQHWTFCVEGCRFSTVQCSLTYLAKGWGEKPVSLGGGGAGAISSLEDIIRAEGAGLFPEAELWALAAEATYGTEPDVGQRGCGGWTRAAEEEEDELGEDGPAAGRDLGYSSGRGPLLQPHLTLYEPIPGELAARRQVALLEKTKEEVRRMVMNKVPLITVGLWTGGGYTNWRRCRGPGPAGSRQDQAVPAPQTGQEEQGGGRRTPAEDGGRGRRLADGPDRR